jgi:hypothetical protein
MCWKRWVSVEMIVGDGELARASSLERKERRAMDTNETERTSVVEQRHASGLWDLARALLQEWEPTWAETCVHIPILAEAIAAGAAPEVRP